MDAPTPRVMATVTAMAWDEKDSEIGDAEAQDSVW